MSAAFARFQYLAAPDACNPMNTSRTSESFSVGTECLTLQVNIVAYESSKKAHDENGFWFRRFLVPKERLFGRLLGLIFCEIENADRKRKTAFFDQKKKLSYAIGF